MRPCDAVMELDTPTHGYRHEALVYEGDADFVMRATPLVTDALDAGAAALVAVGSPRLELLREAVGAAAERVRWVDITKIGENPARIIPLWREFLGRESRDAPASFFGIGQPIYPERSDAALAEAQRHEALLNFAFDGSQDFRLVCPYDARALPHHVIRQASRSHPVMTGDAGVQSSASYRRPHLHNAPFDTPLPGPPATAASLRLNDGVTAGRFAYTNALNHGVGAKRAEDFSLGVVALVNCMSPRGELRVWPSDGAVVAELSEWERVQDPLAGREWPPATGGPARGLWIANQVCDLVQLRDTPAGSTVRLHVNRAAA